MRQMTRFLPSNPFAITYDAILRPSRCTLFFKGGRRNLLAATIATCLVVGAMLAGIGLLLPQIIPIKRTTLLYALLLSPVCSILPIGLLIQGSSSELSVQENMLLWFLRCQLIITPPVRAHALAFRTRHDSSLARRYFSGAGWHVDW